MLIYSINQSNDALVLFIFSKKDVTYFKGITKYTFINGMCVIQVSTYT